MSWRRLLLLHRWLSIPLAVLVGIWLVSGAVMLFVPRPALTPAEALGMSSPLRASQIKVSPWEAWQRLGLPGHPESLRLVNYGDRPTYLFLVQGSWRASLADGSGPLPRLDANQAGHQAMAMTGRRPQRVEAVERDLWAMTGATRAHRPLWRVDLEGPGGLSLYLSQATGEPVLDTWRKERAWNYLGSIPHWLYITPLRLRTGLWSQTVLWSSALATLAVMFGLLLGIKLLRQPSRGFSPYRHPWRRAHHLAGLCAAGFLLAWLVS